ncbi:VOC family protein [Fodinicola acaciae]|uniref:VOC family protein n=1 Tax=Fodinicola acaciae TaxID=2681555 RepID=UPI0013D0E9A3|nr:VOC family protein [Fodinicola acaciae]
MALATIFPTLRYKDPQKAVEWLCEAFGFQAKGVYQDDDGAIVHAELAYGNGLVMFGQDCGDESLATPAGAASVYVVVADPDAHHDRAKAAGAVIVRGLTDQDYGSREYVAKDFEGNIWSFGTYQTALAEA